MNLVAVLLKLINYSHVSNNKKVVHDKEIRKKLAHHAKSCDIIAIETLTPPTCVITI